MPESKVINPPNSLSSRSGLPIVAIVGRPNVGKSTLFNRLAGDTIAVVEDSPGTTRDRLAVEVEWAGRRFLIVDTGGLGLEDTVVYTPLVRRQVETAIDDADAIVMLVDAYTGSTALDWDVADDLRRAGKPMLLAVNKADNEARRSLAMQFHELGVGEPLPISAYHNIGISALLDRLVAILPDKKVDTEPAIRALPVAIVGRPNVGKSMLVNAILGEERLIVSDEPGTTRDAVDTFFEYEGRTIALIDTAGIRRRGKIVPGVEQHSVLRTRRALARAEVAVVVVDAAEGVSAQDAHIMGQALENYLGIVVAVNKWDLADQAGTSEAEFEKYVRGKLHFIPWAPITFVSAKEGRGIDSLLTCILKVDSERRRRIETSEVNHLVQSALSKSAPLGRQGKRLKILYVTQAETSPPAFVFFVNDPTMVHFSHKRYLENVLRRHFGFQGAALKLVFRGRSGE